MVLPVPRPRRPTRSSRGRRSTGLVVALFFFALMLGPANPFKTLATDAGRRAAARTRCCRTIRSWRSTRRCSTSGYVGFTVPFCFAIAALVTGRFGEGWLADTRRATLVAWGFLTVGIMLGAWWSYEVLGWGGYWAWDPVENASLLPWLTATAFIHSVIVQERRGMLRVWNLSLVIATFCLTILGTFLTRSGVLNSVHSFTQSAIGPWLLAFLGVVAAVGIGLIAWRGDRLRTPGRIDSPVSREAAFLANNLLFAGARVRRAARHRVPAAGRGAAGPPAVGGRAVLRPHDHADRARAPVPHGGRARAAVAGDERRGAAPAGCWSPRGRARRHAGGGRARRPRARPGARVRARRVRRRRHRPTVLARAADRSGSYRGGAGQPAAVRRAGRALGVVLVAVALASSSGT